MPFLFLIPAIISTGALAFRTVTDETQQTVQETGPQLATLALAALGAYAAYQIIRKGKI